MLGIVKKKQPPKAVRTIKMFPSVGSEISASITVFVEITTAHQTCSREKLEANPTTHHTSVYRLLILIFCDGKEGKYRITEGRNGCNVSHFCNLEYC